MKRPRRLLPNMGDIKGNLKVIKVEKAGRSTIITSKCLLCGKIFRVNLGIWRYFNSCGEGDCKVIARGQIPAQAREGNVFGNYFVFRVLEEHNSQGNVYCLVKCIRGCKNCHYDKEKKLLLNSVVQTEKHPSFCRKYDPRSAYFLFDFDHIGTTDSIAYAYNILKESCGEEMVGYHTFYNRLFRRYSKEVIEKIKKSGKDVIISSEEARQICLKIREKNPKTTYKVYKITNPTGEVYIGITLNQGQTRFKQHIQKPNKKMQRSFMTFGIDNHKIQVLETTDNFNEAQKKELYYIDKYDSIKQGLNMRRGGAAEPRSMNESNQIIDKFITQYSDKSKKISLVEFSKENNIPSAKVRLAWQRAKRLGLVENIRPLRRTLSKNIKEKEIEECLVNSNLSIRQIAEKHNISFGKVKEIKKRIMKQKPGIFTSNGRRLKINIVHQKIIGALILYGYNYNDIEKIMRVSRACELSSHTISENSLYYISLIKDEEEVKMIINVSEKKGLVFLNEMQPSINKSLKGGSFNGIYQRNIHNKILDMYVNKNMAVTCIAHELKINLSVLYRFIKKTRAGLPINYYKQIKER